MNKEQIIDDAYFKRYRLEAWGECDRRWLLELDGINLTTGEEGKVHRQLTKEEFINKCKTDSGFSETWGLKIEERELDMMERWSIANLTPNMTEFDYCDKLCDEYNIPTKLITITYNGTKIESYE